MSDEKVKSSVLELEEKVAVGAVFLLAGWFLWQFLGKDSAVQLVSNEPELLESTSRVRLFQDDDALRVDEDVHTRIKTEPVIAEPATVTVQSITESAAPVQKRWINRSEGVVPTVSAPRPPNLVPVPQTAKLVEPVVEIVEQPVIAVTPEPVKKTVETVKPTIVTKSVSTRVAPTIQPVTSDLSQGLLRLSGTGQPGGHLQLLLNGRKASNIPVDTKGNWHYESNLEPGEYSVQVLSMELDEQLGVQSALANVTISKPQPPVSEVIVDPVSTGGAGLEPVSEPVVTKAIVTPEKQKQVSSKQKLNDRFYKVQYGDTLNKLSKRFRVSLRSLVRANNVSDKNQIEVGQMLIIPGRYPGKVSK